MASDMCEYMDDCNKKGTCGSDGKCVCNAGYYGADCSVKVTSLDAPSGVNFAYS